MEPYDLLTTNKYEGGPDNISFAQKYLETKEDVDAPINVLKGRANPFPRPKELQLRPILSKEVNDEKDNKFLKKILSNMSIDSRERDINLYTSPQKYIIPFNFEFKFIQKLRLKQFAFINNFPLIPNQDKYLVWSFPITGEVHDIYIPDGYTNLYIPNAFDENRYTVKIDKKHMNFQEGVLNPSSYKNTILSYINSSFNKSTPVNILSPLKNGFYYYNNDITKESAWINRVEEVKIVGLQTSIKSSEDPFNGISNINSFFLITEYPLVGYPDNSGPSTVPTLFLPVIITGIVSKIANVDASYINLIEYWYVPTPENPETKNYSTFHFFDVINLPGGGGGGKDLYRYLFYPKLLDKTDNTSVPISFRIINSELLIFDKSISERLTNDNIIHNFEYHEQNEPEDLLIGRGLPFHFSVAKDTIPNDAIFNSSFLRYWGFPVDYTKVEQIGAKFKYIVRNTDYNIYKNVALDNPGIINNNVIQDNVFPHKNECCEPLGNYIYMGLKIPDNFQKTINGRGATLHATTLTRNLERHLFYAKIMMDKKNTYYTSGIEFIKCFNDDIVGNINSLVVEFFDSLGEPLDYMTNHNFLLEIEEIENRLKDTQIDTRTNQIDITNVL
jgi:hypothetical protein